MLKRNANTRKVVQVHVQKEITSRRKSCARTSRECSTQLESLRAGVRQEDIFGRLETRTDSQAERIAKAAWYQPAVMAIAFQVSLRQLERLFMDRFGKNPSDWCREVRAREAIELIAGGMPIKAVAAELCYANGSHFCHEFKKVYRVSPRAFRLEACPKPLHVDLKQ